MSKGRTKEKMATREKPPVTLGPSEEHGVTIPQPRHDLKILQSLRRIIRHTELHSRHLASSYQITGPQLICLLEIRACAGITASHLSKCVFLSPSTLVGILDRLEAKGLIIRSRDKKDRRKVYLSLTSKGEDFCKQAPSPLQERFFSELSKLPDSEKAVIAVSLERVVELMEAGVTDAAPILESGPLDS